MIISVKHIAWILVALSLFLLGNLIINGTRLAWGFFVPTTIFTILFCCIKERDMEDEFLDLRS